MGRLGLVWVWVWVAQRGLNSAIIAIWCAAGASSPWDFIAKVLYVGGDADTVGASANALIGLLYATPQASANAL